MTTVAQRQRYMAKLRADPVRHAAYLRRMCLRNVAKEKRDRATRAGWARLTLADIRIRCRTKGIPFSLELEDLAVPLLCPVLGTPIILGRGRLNPNSPSVDRHIPALGYVKGNVTVISWRANRLKSDCTSADELRKVADYISRTQQ